MTRMIRLMAVSTLALGLTACGGGAKLGGGKQGAAQAAFQASQGASRTSKPGQALEKALASGLTGAYLFPCAKSGTVGIAVDLGSTSNAYTGTFGWVLRYDACNEDGHNAYNGDLSTSMLFGADPRTGQAAFTIALKGKLTIEGEVSDFIDADVRLSMDLSATSLRSGNVSLVLDGTVKTSTGSYTYAHESLSTLAGELPRD